MMINLRDYELLPIFLVSLVLFLAASEIGHWLGARTFYRSVGEYV
jgi:hypothetical protein